MAEGAQLGRPLQYRLLARHCGVAEQVEQRPEQHREQPVPDHRRHQIAFELDGELAEGGGSQVAGGRGRGDRFEDARRVVADDVAEERLLEGHLSHQLEVQVVQLLSRIAAHVALCPQ
eukprot:CAMPEP_0185320080 /NCGR_PEP_ID=MMETSP1363-20130426/53760_1 /TAXON_ID=38817 /ORGANISM="Gephyrocapsa oceanica, Strain RCC1303" /LENGTH=117 /DNA_ID=CAMNT_0027918481 /DNA_START=29 /DNA_END=382 /DNA_ORIENTATION=+